MRKADLHCHSTGSDGRHSVDYLLETYSACGYDIVSITDHYAITMNDDDIIKIKESVYNLKIIVGMEYVARVNNEPVHLLCYFNSNADLSDEIKNYMNMQREFVRQVNKNFKEHMEKKGVYIPDIDYSLLDSTSYEPILNQVVKRYNKSIKETRTEIFSVIKEMKFKSSFQLKIKEIIEAVHKSNGLIIVAHPFEYKRSTVLKAIDLGVDGLEAIYGSYSKKERESLIRLCKKHNLIWTAGSDFHFDHRIDDPRHGDIGSVSLEGEELNEFMRRLEGTKDKK